MQRRELNDFVCKNGSRKKVDNNRAELNKFDDKI